MTNKVFPPTRKVLLRVFDEDYVKMEYMSNSIGVPVAEIQRAILHNFLIQPEIEVLQKLRTMTKIE